jgi:hypothetical protein
LQLSPNEEKENEGNEAEAVDPIIAKKLKECILCETSSAFFSTSLYN